MPGDSRGLTFKAAIDEAWDTYPTGGWSAVAREVEQEVPAVLNVECTAVEVKNDNTAVTLIVLDVVKSTVVLADVERNVVDAGEGCEGNAPGPAPWLPPTPPQAAWRARVLPILLMD